MRSPDDRPIRRAAGAGRTAGTGSDRPAPVPRGSGATKKAGAAGPGGAAKGAGTKAAPTKTTGTKGGGTKAVGTKAVGTKGGGTKGGGTKAGGTKAGGTKGGGTKAAGTKAAGTKAAETKAAGTAPRSAPGGRKVELGAPAAAPRPRTPPNEFPSAGPTAPITPRPVPRRAPAPRPGTSAGPPVGSRSYRSFAEARTARRLRRAVVILLVLGAIGFLIDGASRPVGPRLVPVSDPAAAKGSVGYGTATLSVKSTSRRASVCVLEAVTPAQHEQGLMGRRSIAPYAGMAFVFATPSRDPFWMKGTLIPLSVAWFDASGRFEASTLMPPCPPVVKSCPLYGAGRSYALAVEVPAGRLGALGIGPGSTVQLGNVC